MDKEKTFVKPHERRNKKDKGTHRVKGHTRRVNPKKRSHGGSKRDKDRFRPLPKNVVVSINSLSSEQGEILDEYNDRVKHFDHLEGYLILPRDLVRYIEKKSDDILYDYAESTIKSKVPKEIRDEYEVIG